MYADLEIKVKVNTSSVGFKKGKLEKCEAACAVQYMAVAGTQVPQPQHHYILKVTKQTILVHTPCPACIFI